MENIIGKLEGNVLIGNAGITRKLKADGYSCTICMLVDGILIDVHLTTNQLQDLGESIKSHFESTE